MKSQIGGVLWLVFTVAAIATGLGAVQIVRDAITSPAAAPLSQGEVALLLQTAYPSVAASPRPVSPSATRAAPSRSATPTSRATPSPVASASSTPRSTASSPSPTKSSPSQPPSTSPVAQTRTIATKGGTVVATCRGSQAYLVSWSPAPGYRTDQVARGPATTTGIRFEGPAEVRLAVTCPSGVPVASIQTRD